MVFSDPAISFAQPADAGEITALLNSSYRGEPSRRGWTTEADLIAGDIRTTTEEVVSLINRSDADFLLLRASDQLLGCINLQQQDDQIYFGMFSVQPALQGRGYGKRLLNAVEEYALQFNFRSIYMSVIAVRRELIAWYERHGYSDTGERRIFLEDGISGRHLQPLEFITMVKVIKNG